MPENKNHSARSGFSTSNYILNKLPAEDLERLLPDLERVRLDRSEVIYRHDDSIDYVYFADNAMASVIATIPDGQLAEAGVIGADGIIGIDVLLGSDRAFNETIIQLPDGAHKIKTSAVREEFARGGAFQKLSLQFVRLLMIQISQTALCNRLHTVEERLARWLLLCHDRAEGDDLQLTQEFLGIMLGTNRATVTTSAISLQGGGFIKYARGLITISDREGLEYFACECYRTVKDEYNRVQG